MIRKQVETEVYYTLYHKYSKGNKKLIATCQDTSPVMIREGDYFQTYSNKKSIYKILSVEEYYHEENVDDDGWPKEFFYELKVVLVNPFVFWLKSFFSNNIELIQFGG